MNGGYRSLTQSSVSLVTIQTNDVYAPYFYAVTFVNGQSEMIFSQSTTNQLIDIHDCRFENYQSSYCVRIENVGQANILRNYFTSLYSSNTVYCNSNQYFGILTIAGNNFEGGNGGMDRIQVYGSYDSVSIENNVHSSVENYYNQLYYIYAYGRNEETPCNITFARNNITQMNLYYASQVIYMETYSSRVYFLENTVDRCVSYSVAYIRASTLTMLNNVFSNNQQQFSFNYLITFYATSALINYNFFISNTHTYLLRTDSNIQSQLDATYNYWNASTASEIAQLIYDFIDYQYIGYIVYIPFLNSANVSDISQSELPSILNDGILSGVLVGFFNLSRSLLPEVGYFRLRGTLMISPIGHLYIEEVFIYLFLN